MLSEFQKQVALLLDLKDEEVAPLSPHQIKQVYTTAFTFYENSQYRKAAQLFTQLVLSDPFSEPFWIGLASAKQMTHDYEAAIHAWALASLLNKDSPLPHFHAAECYLKLEETEDALKALEAAIERAPHDLALQERIQHLKSTHNI